MVLWDCHTSREHYFPRPAGQCGSIVPPKYLFARIENPLIKAHALKHWHTLTHNKQKLLKKQLNEMEKADTARAKAKRDEEKKKKSSEKKTARNDKRNDHRRQSKNPPKKFLPNLM